MGADKKIEQKIFKLVKQIYVKDAYSLKKLSPELYELIERIIGRSQAKTKKAKQSQLLDPPHVLQGFSKTAFEETRVKLDKYLRDEIFLNDKEITRLLAKYRFSVLIRDDLFYRALEKALRQIWQNLPKRKTRRTFQRSKGRNVRIIKLRLDVQVCVDTGWEPMWIEYDPKQAQIRKTFLEIFDLPFPTQEGGGTHG